MVENCTEAIEFIPEGFSDCLQLQIPLLLVFLVSYVVTLVGNLGMIFLIGVDPQLHTPTYFFLSHLSLVDLCCSSVVTPQVLANFFAQQKAISLLHDPLLLLTKGHQQAGAFHPSFVLGTLSSGVILVSYTYTLTAILKIRSIKGRRKAFSTCTSHLDAVILFFGTFFFIYVCPSSRFSEEEGKVAAVLYTMVIPMLNPFLYSLRNKEVKAALGRLMQRRKFS
ncbi:olfactory receptor 5G9-like [Apteryx mantelli]|uniref:Olfactory receptor 5G9-like n=1 Tax=Apteryx mantelli TaxID=2696672 RepID=A0ABM4EFE3_9AVES